MQVHLKIGEFAKLSSVTVKTILYYHKIGLLGEPVRSPAGYRLYGLEETKHMLNHSTFVTKLLNCRINQQI